MMYCTSMAGAGVVCRGVSTRRIPHLQLHDVFGSMGNFLSEVTLMTILRSVQGANERPMAYFHVSNFAIIYTIMRVSLLAGLKTEGCRAALDLTRFFNPRQGLYYCG